MGVQVGDAVGNPVHMLLNGDDHIGEGRRAASPGNVEQVGKARHRQAEVIERAGFPFVLNPQTAAPAQVQPGMRAGHRIESGGQHQRIQRVGLAMGDQAGRGDFVNRMLADIHQLHIGAVVGFIIVGVHAQALAANGLRRAEQARSFGVMHGSANLLAHKFCHQRVGLFIQQEVVEGPKQGESAHLPTRFKSGFQFLRRGRQGRDSLGRQIGAEATVHAPVARPEVGVIGLDARFKFGVQRTVSGWHAIGSGALEHGERAGLLSDHGD